MEFFNQRKQNQRNAERFVLILYSVYSINLCFSAIRKGWAGWIYWGMMLALVASWCVFFSHYRNFRTRAVFTTAMIQFTVILYATNMDELLPVVSTFMVMIVLVAFFGLQELMWLTLLSLCFIVFYHGIIASTFALVSQDVLIRLLTQLGNVLCMEYVAYLWLKKGNESNEQIYKIIEALMDAEQSKDDFLSNVSHEIRTPVNTICGMSEMALREHDPEKMREEIFDIRDAGQNLMSLVSDILDFSQLQQGKMDLEEEAYNITSTMNDIINMAMARKGEKPIELIVDCDAGIPRGLLGDEKKIRRVIMNLVDNAIKFTNEGGVIIAVNARREDYGVNLCISVKDTGIGMKEESLEKLFESFSQVDTRRNRQEGGVGLGLAISRALVLKMGGTITVRSRLGRGSVFRVVVPQKILNEEPIGQVMNREKLNIAAYFDMEQFDMMTIRDEYTKLIIHMVQQLQVKCHACRNLAELKRRESREPFSHVFISLEEYQEDEAYFDALAKRARVSVVIDRPNEKYIANRDLLRLYKPFYIIPVVSILNGSVGSEGGGQLIHQGKFTAPDAHILVVDDNRMNIRVVEGLLKEYKIKVSYAVSGQEALEMIENMSYDFVFMDHMMPEMDGVETLHRIRDKVGMYYRHVPIIALTANAAPGNREMFLAEGFTDFVSKPMEISVLERVLRRNLPEEKLIFQTTKESTELAKKNDDKEEWEDKAALNGKEELVIGDLDVSQGILYCGGEQPYLNILEAYCEEGEEHRRLLEELFEKQDWKNYTIKVHALKSTMKSIGAIPLFEKAKALETAGKGKEIDYIRENHGDMIQEHYRVMEELEQCPLISSNRAVTDGQEDNRTKRQELEEEEFDRLLGELEDAAFSLDGERMLDILSELQGYEYHQAVLEKEMASVRKKIERSDYLSASEAAFHIKDSLKNRTGGGMADV